MNRTRLTTAAAATAAAVLAAGCSADGAGVGGADGEPRRGGTLRLLGAADVDHLDTASVYSPNGTALMRAISRQLVTFPTTKDEKDAIGLVPDLATEVPRPADSRTFSFTIREGATWDAGESGRQITGADVERGFKRLCNPVVPSAGASYYIDAIEGMRAFCDGFGKVAKNVTAIREYVEKNDITGIVTKGEREVTFRLTAPMGDFTNLLALVSASPAPAESLDHLPDSPDYRRTVVSSGPYRVSDYRADQKIVLDRNPAWKAASDPLRKAYVDRIEITFGATQDSVMQQLQAGTVDLPWDTVVPPALLPGLAAAKDDRLLIVKTGATEPYLAINLRSPNNGKALSKLKVRQALAYAVDKKAVLQVQGGATVGQIQNQLFVSTLIGSEPFDPYPTPGHRGDPDKARALLAEAGHPDGLTLKLPYRTKDQYPQVAQALQAGLAKAGITLKLIPVTPNDYYGEWLTNDAAQTSGRWDIAPAGWAPDAPGTSHRTVYDPLIRKPSVTGSYNYGSYSNPKADALADRALATSDERTAAELWNRIDRMVMSDVPLIPIAVRNQALYRGANTAGVVANSLSKWPDWTQLWLKK
ncbi:ABC transporter substrate-binding protein [Streptomyces sp. SHP 1-2]|uniref:ABC transporter substrate-binding protein n=1 Tax=Streptomyces sp. SHP 1-2 TaxID=2769489 RepID=UPI0022388C0F|nr:ABC transporter substrate-binding protein [Streptomyces sp. SHP 1-2]MCW5254499.1 ABC transporter substrate-binding protein [Streptomyces sp. SHP 1-2]